MPLEVPEVSVGVADVGVSVLDVALEEDVAAAAVRGAAHSQAPSTTRQPMDSVGAGPSEALDEVEAGPNWAWAPAARSNTVVKSLSMVFRTK